MSSRTQPTSLVSRYWYLAIFAVLAATSVLTWKNYSFAEQNPGGNDFLVHWVGTRSFIMEGISPYSDSTALKIQTQVYGHPAQGDEHQLRVVYPFYSELLYAPFALVGNYNIARAFWMTFLEIAIVFMAIQSMRLVKWRPGIWLLPLYLLFSVLWYHGLRALVNGNAVVIVTLLILGAIVAIRDGNDAVAGILLAFSTIKPNLVVIVIFFVILWAFSHQRWVLIGWIFGGLLIFILLGMAFIPDWLLQNAREIVRFPGYNPALTLGSAFELWWPGIGAQLKWGLTLILMFLSLIAWWQAWGQDFNHFLWTLCLSLVISQWIGIATDPGNFILLFLPMVLVFSIMKERWRVGGDWIVLGMMVILFVGLWWLFLDTVEYGNQPLQSAVMFVPMPFVTLVSLYWVRWWAIRPTRGIVGRSPSNL